MNVLEKTTFAKLYGKRVLVGLTILDHAGKLLEQKQLHGVVKNADDRGIVLALFSGGEYQLPPSPQNFQPARPGVYTLRSTGEEVTDPDFISRWTITKPRTS